MFYAAVVLVIDPVTLAANPIIVVQETLIVTRRVGGPRFAAAQAQGALPKEALENLRAQVHRDLPGARVVVETFMNERYGYQFTPPPWVRDLKTV